MSKLYTEEQVMKLLTNKDYPYMESEELIKTVTPIELPTEEEIYNESPDNITDTYDIGYHNGWMIGAKWMRDKIKGGGE